MSATWPPKRPARQPPTCPVDCRPARSVTDPARRRQRQTTDAGEQSNTAPLGGPATIYTFLSYHMDLLTSVAVTCNHFHWCCVKTDLRTTYQPRRQCRDRAHAIPCRRTTMQTQYMPTHHQTWLICDSQTCMTGLYLECLQVTHIHSWRHW